MKVFIALLLLCIAHESYQQTCGDEKWGEEVWNCYKNNGVGDFFSGSGISYIHDLCSNYLIDRLSACMLNVTKTCPAGWYDRGKFTNAKRTLCNRAFNFTTECDVKNLRLSQCISEMKREWDMRRPGKDKNYVHCNLYGGIKKCIYDNMMKCSIKESYKDLLETFTPIGCAPYWNCRFCRSMSGSPAIVTTSIASVVGAIFLHKLL